MATRAAVTGKAPAALRQAPTSLADKIRGQMDAIRNRKYAPLGLVMRIQLGVSDDCAYMQGQANDHLRHMTKFQGLSFEWDQTNSPKICEMIDGFSGSTGNREFVFPDLWPKLPRIPDPGAPLRTSPSAPATPRISQNLEYFASGKILGAGVEFMVLQPVLQIAIRPFGASTFLMLNGKVNPWDGKYPALLVEKKARANHQMAFLIGGRLEF